MIFDLLWLDGRSLMELTYDERRAALATLGLDAGERWRVSTELAGSGRDILAATRAQHLEGVLANAATAATSRGDAAARGSRSATSSAARS